MYYLNKIVKFQNSVGKVVSQLGTSGEISVMDSETLELNRVKQTLSELEVLENSHESTVEAFYDKLANNYFFDDAIQEMKTLQESGVSEKLMTMTVNEAIKQGVYLSDLDDFDYDSFFYPIFKDYRL